MQNIIRNLGALCLIGAALAGCTASAPAGSSAIDEESTDDGALDIDGAPQAVKLRFVHGSPTSPALDVYVGASTAPLFTGVAFGTATPYAAVSPDGLQLVLRTAGAAPTDAPVYTSDAFTAQIGDTITSIAGGVLGSPLATIKFRVQPYTEAFADAPRGQTQIRFVHDSHGVAAAGFDVGADGAIEVDGVAPFAASDPAGIAVHRAPRSVQLAIDTGAPARQLTSFTVPREVLAQRGGVFLALVGVPAFVPRDSRGLALLAVGRKTTALVRQNPTVYLLPAIPDVPAIDAFAIGDQIPVVKAATNLSFGALAPALQVPPSEHGYLLVVTRAASETSPGLPLALQSTGALVAGERYLAIASGFADRAHARVRVTIEQDEFDRTVTANGRIRAVAASPDAPALDFGRFAPGTGTPFTGVAGLENLAYRQASAGAGVEVTPAPLNPGVRVTGAADALRFRFGALTATDRVFGVVAGAFTAAEGEIGTQFLVIRAPASGSWTATPAPPQI